MPHDDRFKLGAELDRTSASTPFTARCRLHSAPPAPSTATGAGSPRAEGTEMMRRNGSCFLPQTQCALIRLFSLQGKCLFFLFRLKSYENNVLKSCYVTNKITLSFLFFPNSGSPRVDLKNQTLGVYFRTSLSGEGELGRGLSKAIEFQYAR